MKKPKSRQTLIVKTSTLAAFISEGTELAVDVVGRPGYRVEELRLIWEALKYFVSRRWNVFHRKNLVIISHLIIKDNNVKLTGIIHRIRGILAMKNVTAFMRFMNFGISEKKQTLSL